MSYALGQVPSRASTPPIRVGDGARRDVLLSRASLLASQILYRMVKTAPELRDARLKRELRSFGIGAYEKFRINRRRLARTHNPNQATYDALRLVISNHFAEQLSVKLKHASALSRDASALGVIEMNDDERAVACGVTGGLTLITGLVGGIYGGEAGATAAGTGGGVAAETFGCNQEARQSAERIAAANAAAAQVQANAALQAAQAQARATEAKTKQITKLAIAGGGAVLLLAVGYVILKA